MFEQSILKAVEYTRAVHTILRYDGATEVHPAAASLFVVNADGWALTCKHVAEILLFEGQVVGRRIAYKQALQGLPAGKKAKQQRAQLAGKHGFGPGQIVELKNSFVNLGSGQVQYHVFAHPTLDIALIHFQNASGLGIKTFPMFAKNHGALNQGKFLCRLGFPFAEFANFAYDQQTDSIGWTQSGRIDSPTFPLEGMVTRHLIDGGKTVGFEMSTPGLKGQSGGPVFDSDGRVWGMQWSTFHLDLDFDVDLPVWRNGKRSKIHESAILHVGRCIHVSELKAFMSQHKVSFQEG